MQNHTDCVTVVRTYYIEVTCNQYEEVHMEEYIFKKSKGTRRYCMMRYNGSLHTYEITNHDVCFFDNIVKASNGWALFNLYLKEKIDPAPSNRFISLSNNKKYENIKELYVIFNCTYQEKHMLSIIKKNKRDL